MRRYCLRGNVIPQGQLALKNRNGEGRPQTVWKLLESYWNDIEFITLYDVLPELHSSSGKKETISYDLTSN